MGVSYTLIQDAADQYDTPSDGEFRMYSGGTTLKQTAKALDAKATLSLQQYCTPKTLEYCAAQGQDTAAFHYPLGIAGTDELLIQDLRAHRHRRSPTLSRSSAVAWSMPWPTASPGCMARSTRSMAIRISSTA